MLPRLTIAILTAMALAACAASKPAEGALPAGIADARIPRVDGSAYIYVRPPVPGPFSSDALGIDGAIVDTISVLLADDGTDHFTRFAIEPRDPRDAPLRGPDATSRQWVITSNDTLAIGPTSAWGEAVRESWEQQDLVTIHGRFPDAWRDLVKAPANPPSPPIAAGFVRNFGPLIERFLARAGVSIPGLHSDLALLRIESVAFVAYSDRLDRLPDDVAPGVLDDVGLSVLAIADSAYPSAVVYWVFTRFTTNLGLRALDLQGTPAHHREITAGVHIVVVRHESTLFFAIASTQAGAEELATAVARST